MEWSLTTKKKKPKERNSGLKRVAAPAPSSYCGQINGGDTRCFDLIMIFPPKKKGFYSFWPVISLTLFKYFLIFIMFISVALFNHR